MHMHIYGMVNHKSLQPMHEILKEEEEKINGNN